MTERVEVGAPGKGIATAKPAASDIALTENSGVILRTFEDLKRFAATIVAAGLCPKGMDERSVAIAIQAGAELGMSIMTSVRGFAVVNGNLSLMGNAALALLRGPRGKGILVPGTLNSWVEGEGDDRVGVCVSQRVGYSEPFRTEFSVKDAKLAGLWGKRTSTNRPTAWVTNPDWMLEWRACGRHVNKHYSEVVGGFPLAEEVQDWQDLGPRRGETPATRQGPPPKADPLLEAIGVEAKVVDSEPVEVEPIPEPVKCDGNHAAPRCEDPECWRDDEPCPRHGDVTESPCWKCEAEAQERAEAEAEREHGEEG